jgi:hypothetical protein
MKASPVVVGVADHGGWAVLVCAAAVIDRRRVPIIDPGVPTQPYHHDTLAMPDAESERLVRTVMTSVASCTAAAFDHLSADLGPRHRIVAIAIRQPPLPHLPASVKEAHASYYVQCRADGMLYHAAICADAERRGWDVVQHPRGGEVALAANALGARPADVERFLDGLKKTLGPPWAAEHRNVFAAAIAGLGDGARLRLP